MDCPAAPDEPIDHAVASVRMWRVAGSEADELTDELAVEDPLEIRIAFDRAGRRVRRGISVTMRTPGHDRELAIGFLVGEGIIEAGEQVASVEDWGAGNVVRVELRPGVDVDTERLERHFFTTSSCGVCGKASLEGVHVAIRSAPLEGRPLVEAQVIRRLPEALRSTQRVFDRTGGLHAAALFDTDGRLLEIREDVGRHNALDKLIGAACLAGRLPLHDALVLVSGRLSFELVQKAAVAGIPVLAAVGAPSSLAVELARRHGMTVIGFLRTDRFNLYCGHERILPQHLYESRTQAAGVDSTRLAAQPAAPSPYGSS